MIQIIKFLTYYQLIELWGILFFSTPDNNINKSSARYNKNFSFIWILVLSIYKYQSINKNSKNFLVSRLIISRSDKYIDLNLI